MYFVSIHFIHLQGREISLPSFYFVWWCVSSGGQNYYTDVEMYEESNQIWLYVAPELKWVWAPWLETLLIYTGAGKDLVWVCVCIPPWWLCVWGREHTPGPRQNSTHHIASPTHRTGRRDGASPPVTPAKPPPGCLEAHSHSANKPPTTGALVEINQYILYWFLSISSKR